MDIRIPATGSLVAGQLTGGQAARSKRSNVNIYDEFAHVENATAVLQASASIAGSNIYVSTVKGMNNEFARIAHEKATLKKTLHWRDSQHPTKNEKWAILERSDTSYTDESWAQEHDIAYETSTSARVYPKFRSYSEVLHEWTHIQRDDYFTYDPNYNVCVGIDFGLSDPLAAVYVHIKPMIPEFPNPFGNIMVIFDEDEQRDLLYDHVAFLLNGKGYIYEEVVGDWRSANRRDPSGNTYKSVLRQYGLEVVGRYNSEEAPIMAVRKRLSYPGALAIHYKCTTTIRAMQNWSFPVDKDTGDPLSDSKPLHNRYSHINKALAYLIDYKEGEDLGKKKNTPVTHWNSRDCSVALL